MRHIYKFISWEDYESQKEYLSIPNIVYIDNQSIIIANGVDEVTAAMPERLPLPVISCANNKVTITCEEPLVTMYYTTDGTEATTDSTVYTGQFNISESCLVNVLVVKYGFLPNMTSQWCEYVEISPNVVHYTTNDGNMINDSELIINNLTLINHTFDGYNGVLTFDNTVEKMRTPGMVSSGMNVSFDNVSNVESVEVPVNVIQVGNNGFGISTIVYCRPTTPPEWLANPFKSIPDVIYVPADSYDAYTTATGWSDYAEYMQSM